LTISSFAPEGEVPPPKFSLSLGFFAVRNFSVVLKDRIETVNSLNPGISGPTAKGNLRSFGAGESIETWQK
jgi:hypothetical protein